MWCVRGVLPVLACSFFGAVSAAGVQESGGAQLTEVAADLAILTEVSEKQPCVGQQFSIVYRLRARRPPAAVDLNPQQFPGFWTEIVPLPPETTPLSRRWKGRAATDFLLRQVVAFPVFEGRLQLPPLSIKVKRAGAPSPGRDDWDVVASSEPLEIEVLPTPAPSQAGGKMPFVGDVRGTMLLSEDNGEARVLLDIEGTANLSFFKPQDWLDPPEEVFLSSELMSSESTTQTRAVSGQRSLTVLQRQRWQLRFLPRVSQEFQVADLVLPVYRPAEKRWGTAKIEGVAIPASDPIASVVQTEALLVPDSGGGRPQDSVIWPWLLSVVVTAALGLGLALRLRRSPAADRRRISIPLLEKRANTSPKSFLDGAYRMLVQYARQNNRAHDIGRGNDLADRCWHMIEQYRFSADQPPAEVRREILTSLRVLYSRNPSSSERGHL